MSRVIAKASDGPQTLGARQQGAASVSIEASKLGVLRVICWLLVAGPATFLSLLYPVLPEHPAQALGPALILLLAALSLVLIRIGYEWAAAHLLVYGGWLAIAVHALISGNGIHTPQLAAMPLGIMLSGWLLGGRHAIAVTALGVGLSLALVLLPEKAVSLPPLLILLPRSVVAVGVCVLTLYIVRTYESRLAEVHRLGEALEEEKNQLHLLAENVPAMIFHGDREMRCRYANRQFADFFHGGGVPLEGMHLREILGDEIYAAALPDIGRVLAGESVQLEGKRQSKAAGVRHLEISLVPERGADGSVAGFYALKRDVTDRLRVERALSESEAQLHLVAENVPAMIAYNDREFILRYANRHYMDFFGIDAGAIGRHIRHVIGAETFEKVAPMLGKAISGEAVSYRALRRTAAGEERIIEVEAVPDRSADGTVRGAYALMRDITEQQRAEDEVRRLNDELETRVKARTAELQSANRELESFAYSISHDLRAPLRGIDGFSQLLADEYRDRLDAQGVDYLDRVRRAAQRMGTLIDDILELSRVTRQEMRRVSVDLSRIAEELIEERIGAEPGRRVAVSIASACTASGDPQLLRVLMQNLLENAWKYSCKADPARIEFGLERTGGEEVFFVRDNGVGFDMQYAGRLFAPFQRLHTPEEFEGTGIGLATVARVVHRHGGRVWAEAGVGRGAVFRFTLPP